MTRRLNRSADLLLLQAKALCIVKALMLMALPGPFVGVPTVIWRRCEALLLPVIMQMLLTLLLLVLLTLSVRVATKLPFTRTWVRTGRVGGVTVAGKFVVPKIM